MQTANDKQNNNFIDIVKELLKLIESNEMQKVKEQLAELNKGLAAQSKPSENFIKLETAGKGSYAPVYRFFDLTSRIFLAQKDLTKFQDEESDSFNFRALQEVKALLKIIKKGNPDILQIYRIDYEPDNYCQILMEYGVGTLKELIQFARDENVKYDKMEEIPDKIQSQVDLLKKIKISHNDLHSNNIIVRENKSFACCDFGEGTSLDCERCDTVEPIREELDKFCLDQKVNKIGEDEFFKGFIASRICDIYEDIDFDDAIKLDLQLLKWSLPNDLVIRLDNKLKKIEEEKGSLAEKDILKKFTYLDLLGLTHRRLHDYHTSLDYHKKALETLKDLPDTLAVKHQNSLLANFHIGNMYFELGRYNAALEHYAGAEKIFQMFSSQKLEKNGGEWPKALVDFKIGQCHSFGDKTKAIEYFEKSKKAFEKLKSEEFSRKVDFELAFMEQDAGKMQEYINFLEENHLIKSSDGYYAYRAKMIVDSFLGNKDEFDKSSKELTKIASDLYGESSTFAKDVKKCISSYSEQVVPMREIKQITQLIEYHESQGELMKVLLLYTDKLKAYLQLGYVEEFNMNHTQFKKIAWKFFGKCSVQEREPIKQLEKEMENLEPKMKRSHLRCSIRELRVRIGADKQKVFPETKRIVSKYYAKKTQLYILEKEKDKAYKSYKKAKENILSLVNAKDSEAQEYYDHLRDLLKMAKEEGLHFPKC